MPARTQPGSPERTGSTGSLPPTQSESDQNGTVLTSEEETTSLCSQLEEAIKCAICWELPTSPKVLPCQHSFCLRCLYPSYLSDLRERHHSRDRIQCPLCRQVHVVPKRGLVAFPNDRHTAAFTDIIRRRRRLQRRKLCQVCKATSQYVTADYCCLTCGTALCSACQARHQANRLYADHIQGSLFAPDSSNLFCADHPRENVLYYCGDCERPICSACTHTKHATHRTTTFAKASSADTEVLTGVMQFVADTENYVLGYQKQLGCLLKTSITDKELIKSELAEIRAEISKLQEREAEMERRLRMHETVEKRLMEMNGKVTTALARLKRLDDVITSSATPIRGHVEYTVNEPSLQSIQKAFTSIELPSRDLTLMADQYRRMVADYGDAADQDVEGTHYFADIDADTINAGVKVLWQSDQTTYDVHFLSDGSRRLICTDQSRDWKLFALNFDGSPAELPTSLEQFADCQCRLMVNSTTATMCLTHKRRQDGWNLPFTVIHPDGRTETGSIQTSHEQNSLCSILVTRYHDVVFSFMSFGFPPQSTSLRCHSPGGAYRWYRDTGAGCGDGRLISPHYVTVDPLDRIIISDHYGGKVSIYDNIGRHLFSFPKIILPEGEDVATSELHFPRPSGVCVDSKGFIYVAFPTHDVISLFTPNGQYLRHMVVTKGKVRGITICEDRYLAVTTFEGLWLYDIAPEAKESRGMQKQAENTTEKEQGNGQPKEGMEESAASKQDDIQRGEVRKSDRVNQPIRDSCESTIHEETSEMTQDDVVPDSSVTHAVFCAHDEEQHCREYDAASTHSNSPDEETSKETALDSSYEETSTQTALNSPHEETSMQTALNSPNEETSTQTTLTSEKRCDSRLCGKTDTSDDKPWGDGMTEDSSNCGNAVIRQSTSCVNSMTPETTSCRDAASQDHTSCRETSTQNIKPGGDTDAESDASFVDITTQDDVCGGTTSTHDITSGGNNMRQDKNICDMTITQETIHFGNTTEQDTTGCNETDV